MLYEALISAVLVSLVSLVGLATLVFRQEGLIRATFLLVSLATGALFGDAIFHLMPEIYSGNQHQLRSSLWILAGIFSSFVFEKFLRWKHAHGIEQDGDHGHAHSHIKPVGRIILLSDGLHNLVDGILIGASYLASREVGIATTLAVVLHEIPHELGDFGVLLDAGYSFSRALLFNFLCACISIAGVFVAFGFQAGLSNFSEIALPVTAGSFLYIAGSNLTPELQKENAPLKSLLQIVAMTTGAGMMLLILLFKF